MTPVKQVLLEFLKTMRLDLIRRAWDESGEQRAETLERASQLYDLILELEGRTRQEDES